MVALDKNTFSQLLKNPKKITLEQSLSVKKIINQYPFFQIARIIEIIGLKKHDHLKFNNALKSCAIYSTDRSVLYDIIEKKIRKRKKIQCSPRGGRVCRRHGMSGLSSGRSSSPP